MTALMSTSLKVVSMAAVFCASFRRRATVWRRRVIFTRSSRSCTGRGPAATGGAARCRDAPPSSRALGGPLRGRTLFQRRQGVALGDAAVLAGTGDLGGVEIVLGGDALHRRGQGLG